jgi:hypothetical protein
VPIILFPVDLPVSSEISCQDQILVQPSVPTIEGRTVPARIASVEVVQGQEAFVRWTMRNRAGEIIDLTSCNLSSSSSSVSSIASPEPPSSVRLRIQETLSFYPSIPVIEIGADAVDAVNGVVQARLTAAAVKCAGIYKIEWAVFDSDSKLLFTNQGFLVVDKGLFGEEISYSGPLTIPEIRLHLRDNNDGDNFLIDTSEWSLAELVACIERPVLYFNETNPPINTRYNTKNFPYRFNWLNGTVAGLYETAAHHYRRNSKTFQASSGVNLDDKQKAAEYEQKSQALWTDYKKFVQNRKVSLNMEACFGSTSEIF